MSHFSRPARRRGPIYCAPWCGANCTWKAHQKAKRDAKKLAGRLGPDWKPHVWENMGWHYSVICGAASVRTSYGGGFSADVHIGEKQFIFRADSPRAAFAGALAESDRVLKKFKADRAALEGK